MKRSKSLDILVYLFFAGILVMFGFLFLQFFRTGHFELVEERLPLSREINTVKILSNASLVEIHSTQEDAPYLVYDRQVAQSKNLDNVQVREENGTVTVEIVRQKSNQITNIGASSAKVALYLPENSGVSVLLDLDVLQLSVTSAQLKELTVVSHLCDLKLTDSQVESLAVKGNVGALRTDNSTCQKASVFFNVGALSVKGLSESNGLSLKSHVNLGYAKTDRDLELPEYGILVNDQETRACDNGAQRFEVQINLAFLQFLS